MAGTRKKKGTGYVCMEDCLEHSLLLLCVYLRSGSLALLVFNLLMVVLATFGVLQWSSEVIACTTITQTLHSVDHPKLDAQEFYLEN